MATSRTRSPPELLFCHRTRSEGRDVARPWFGEHIGYFRVGVLPPLPPGESRIIGLLQFIDDIPDNYDARTRPARSRCCARRPGLAPSRSVARRCAWPAPNRCLRPTRRGRGAGDTGNTRLRALVAALPERHVELGSHDDLDRVDDLRDHTALVTGATSGIGRAIAVQLARMGADVLVHGRDATRGRQVVEEIERAGGTARFVAADLSDPADLQRLVEAVGEVDVLVNSAGFSWFGPTADLDIETFDALFASDVRAPYFLVAVLAPKMAAKGKGSIVNVSSMAGQIGLAGAAAYGATKGAMSSMTRAWAAEFSPQRCAGERHRARPGVHRGCST